MYPLPSPAPISSHPLLRGKKGTDGSKKEDVVAGVERVLGPVAVVNVPIGDEDPAEAPFPDEMFGGHGDVVEQAKSLGRPPLGVMAGRSDESEGVPSRPGEDKIGGFDGSAGGQEGGLVGQRRGRGISVERRVGPLPRPGEKIDVLGSVDAGELGGRGRAGRDPGRGKSSSVLRRASIASSRSGHSMCPGPMKWPLKRDREERRWSWAHGDGKSFSMILGSGRGVRRDTTIRLPIETIRAG